MYTVAKEEAVEVPAGKFQELRVEMVTQVGGTRIESLEWVAPGVGMVKSVTRVHDESERVQVLKSYTPGKK